MQQAGLCKGVPSVSVLAAGRPVTQSRAHGSRCLRAIGWQADAVPSVRGATGSWNASACVSRREAAAAAGAAAESLSGQQFGRGSWLGSSSSGGLGLLMVQTVNKRRLPLSRAHSADGLDIEELVPSKGSGPSSEYGESLFFSVAAACLAAMLFGYHLGVVNGAMEYVARDLGFTGNAALKGWVVSITLVGATLGSFTGGAFADKFGRTRTFQLDAIPLIIGALLSASARSTQAMLIGRFLVGLGIGVSSGVVPLYIAEISPTEIRGSLGSVNQLSICIGILGALLAGLPLAGNPIWWKSMFTVAVIPAVLLVIGMAYAPESPRWLYQRGMKAEAETAIRKLWGEGKVKQAMTELEDASAGGASEESSKFTDMFSSKYAKVVSVGAMLFFLQQFAGINAVVYYSTAVFRSAGVKSDVAASAVVGAANVFGSLVASSMMDKQGRKKLMIGSFIGMATSMSILALALSWSALAPYAGTLAVAGTVSYVLSFALGVGPVPGLILPEIFPSKIRANGVALSLGVHWISNFVIGLYFLPVVTKYGVSSAYVVFAAVCAFGALYVHNNVLETKGKSLEEIERVLIPQPV